LKAKFLSDLPLRIFAASFSALLMRREFYGRRLSKAIWISAVADRRYQLRLSQRRYS